MIVYRVMVPYTELVGGAVLDFSEPVHDYAQVRTPINVPHSMHPVFLLLSLLGI